MSDRDAILKRFRERMPKPAKTAEPATKARRKPAEEKVYIPKISELEPIRPDESISAEELFSDD